MIRAQQDGGRVRYSLFPRQGRSQTKSHSLRIEDHHLSGHHRRVSLSGKLIDSLAPVRPADRHAGSILPIASARSDPACDRPERRSRAAAGYSAHRSPHCIDRSPLRRIPPLPCQRIQCRAKQARPRSQPVRPQLGQARIDRCARRRRATDAARHQALLDRRSRRKAGTAAIPSRFGNRPELRRAGALRSRARPRRRSGIDRIEEVLLARHREYPCHRSGQRRYARRASWLRARRTSPDHSRCNRRSFRRFIADRRIPCDRRCNREAEPPIDFAQEIDLLRGRALIRLREIAMGMN